MDVRVAAFCDDLEFLFTFGDMGEMRFLVCDPPPRKHWDQLVSGTPVFIPIKHGSIESDGDLVNFTAGEDSCLTVPLLSFSKDLKKYLQINM